MKIEDRELVKITVEDAKRHIASLSNDERKTMIDVLSKGSVFAMENIEKTMLLFALYKIGKITYIDLSTSIENYLNNQSLITKDITNYELLMSVEIYARD